MSLFKKLLQKQYVPFLEGNVYKNRSQKTAVNLLKTGAKWYIIAIFFVSFNVFNHNDTDKVWVMGDFSNPVFLHDSAQWGMDNYLGCFKRRNTFCFFYKCVLSSQKNVKESTRVVSFLLKDWRLRTPYDNPEFFPKDISGTIRDPYIFEYMVDSIGSLSLLRKGHW